MHNIAQSRATYHLSTSVWFPETSEAKRRVVHKYLFMYGINVAYKVNFGLCYTLTTYLGGTYVVRQTLGEKKGKKRG